MDYEGLYLAMTDGTCVEFQRWSEDPERSFGVSGRDKVSFCGFDRKGSNGYAHQINRMAWNDTPLVEAVQAKGVNTNSRTEEFRGDPLV